MSEMIKEKSKVSSHDAILHTLDRAYEYNDIFVDMSSEEFGKSIDAWNDAILTFGNAHMDMGFADSAPKLAAITSDNVVVGKITNPRIDTAGHARLMATFEYLEEYAEELDRLTSEGRLSLSTGFYSTLGEQTEGGVYHITDIKPNHVLLFVEDEYNRPRDLSSGLINKEGEEVTKEEETDLAAIRADIEVMKNSLAMKDELIASLNLKIEEMTKANDEAEFEALKSTMTPAEITDTAGLTNIKERFMANKTEVYRSRLMMTINKAPGKHEGKSEEADASAKVPIVFKNSLAEQTYKRFRGV